MLVFQGAKGHSFFIKKKGGGSSRTLRVYTWLAQVWFFLIYLFI